MFKDYIRFIFGTFQERKLRSFLTMVGIVIGIAMIVTLISLGQGLQESIKSQFTEAGINSIMISPGGAFFGLGSVGGPKLTNTDIKAIESVPGVKTVGGWVYKISQVQSDHEKKYTFVIGLPLGEAYDMVTGTMNFKVIKGREIKDSDFYKCNIGIDLYEGKFFKKSINLRDKLTIEGKNFEVVGIVGRIGNPQDDSQIYIPLEAAYEIFGVKEEYNNILASVVDEANSEKIAEDIKSKLRKERDVKEGEEDFSVMTFAQLISTYNSILFIVQAVLIGLAAISLLVGGVGIMNTMFTSVLERTREIGIMKAIGARNKDIIMIFLFEAGVLGLAGGIIGTLIGAGISKLVEFIAMNVGYSILRVSISFWLIFGSILFSFLVGCLSGIVPAIRAAGLKPVEALRYE